MKALFCALLLSLAAPVFAGQYVDRLNACDQAPLTCLVELNAYIHVDAPRHGVSQDQLAQFMDQATKFCKDHPESETYNSACSKHEGDVKSGIFYVYVHYVDEAATQTAAPQQQ
ncbi:hypothetical protein [Silvimonas iriomotensis]|uniref:Uncharacterized protein n=1 Tax=Silvimonas iriomotensis TaxID=449662 RepID=A0ABQ2P6L5_9NEIS|nr:hypothetical protein [Silvimonas iriomotensis]GGP18949.1 hypothetical protein GCM10010970_08190 [Silvimonas iriomotensis]